MSVAVQMSGRRFSRLLVLGASSKRTKSKNIHWKCACDCGNKTIVDGHNLRIGHTRSCGCLIPESIVTACKTHGLINEPEYGIWSGMIQRCTNPNVNSFKYYGGRGIKVCDRWLNSFENFYLDMGKRPSLKHTIDRKENAGDYEPSNCCWSTSIEQANNKRNNIHFDILGVSKSLSQWTREYGINYGTAWSRIKDLGWSPIDAVTRPSTRI